MTKFLQGILLLDRRWIYLVVVLLTAITILAPLNLPVFVTPETRGVFDFIEKLKPGDAVLVATDYEPGSRPECKPMAEALLTHCFRKKLRVVGVTIIPVGVGTGEEVLTEMAEKMGAVRGKDYTFLGFKAQYFPSVVGLTISVQDTFQTDRYGNNTSELPVLKGIHRMADFKYFVCVHDDSTIETWVIYGHEPTGLPMGSMCTAVMATGYMTYINAGQLTGIAGGLKGASEYEKLVGYRGLASQGMDSQAVIHMFVVGLMILGNVAYVVTRRKGAKGTV